MKRTAAGALPRRFRTVILRARCLAIALPLLSCLSANAAAGSDNQAPEPAQTAQNNPSKSDAAKEEADESHASSTKSKPKPAEFEEVLVTGTRLRAEAAPQGLQVFSAEQIAQSGQTTVADFLNTLPAMSLTVGENGLQTQYGSTTVQLRGLPFGTTLVLINGRRVESAGLQGSNDFFDLNNLPLAAVERIEVFPYGSSAVYGSDAIAGVVNVILKSDVRGVELNAKYGAAADMNEWDLSAEAGLHGEKGSFSLIASYQTRSDLQSIARRLTASNDYTAEGGQNSNFPTCHPGNVFSVNGQPLPGAPAGSSANYAAVKGAVQSGRPTLADFAYGTLNECSVVAGDDLIPSTHRAGLYGTGIYRLSSSVELFAELLYSRVQLYQTNGSPSLFSLGSSFSEYTVSAANPYNPFGETVAVGDVLSNLATREQVTTTNFFRPLVGIRGSLPHQWQWQLTAWSSEDRTNLASRGLITNNAGLQAALNSSDRAVALNPFIAGPAGPASELQSFFQDGQASYKGRTQAVEGFIRGPIPGLPAGPIELVLGAEYDHDTLESDQINYPPPPGETSYSRHSDSVYGEARVPLLSSFGAGPTWPLLLASVAARRDHYSDFGNVTTPQYRLEMRPVPDVVVFGSYAEAFKAPPLPDLFLPQTSSPSVYKDPITGGVDAVTVISGGNPDLRAQTARSYAAGLSYAGEALPGFKASVTWWETKESNDIENLSPLVLVDNESLFPGRVIRGTGCGAAVCPITTLIDTFANFGYLKVSGIDYQLSYRYPSSLGTWTASAVATETLHYHAAVTPGAPITERVSQASDDANWAPRWKSIAQLTWSRGAVLASFDARYVGPYQDYDSSTYRIGNFWLCDAYVRVQFGRWSGLPATNFTVGAVNLFNRAPQFSNYSADFLGYDPAQADIRGRFVYAQLGAKW